MAQTFARYLGPAEDLPAGMFCIDASEGHRTVIGCPLCGERFGLPSGCGVDQCGRTSHAVQCSRCQFWDFLVLQEHYA